MSPGIIGELENAIGFTQFHVFIRNHTNYFGVQNQGICPVCDENSILPQIENNPAVTLFLLQKLDPNVTNYHSRGH